MNIRIRLAPGAVAPVYKTDGAAGADLCAWLPNGPVRRLWPNCMPVLIPTGVSIELPPGYEAQVRPRSGLSLNGIVVVPGTVDSDYRGQIGVLMYVVGRPEHVVNHGDRIAQLVIAKCERASFTVVDELDATARGNGGFGHTGVR